MWRAVSIPETPESAGLRVFIFRQSARGLTCTHHWAQNPISEEVGLTLKSSTDRADWAVFRALSDRSVCLQIVDRRRQKKTARSVKVSPQITCVLAAPILRQDGSLWGVVDFDASSQAGATLLSTSVAKATLFQLAQHLKLILSLDDPD